MAETLIVAGIVGAMAYLGGKGLVKSLSGKEHQCGCSGGCANGGCCGLKKSNQQKK